MNSEDLSKKVRESKDVLAPLLRAAAHPMRLQLMAFILDGQREFRDLCELSGLGKTALANHLGILIDRGLVERLARGSYDITADGKGLLQSVVELFMRSQIRERLRRRQLVERYSRGYSLGGETRMESFEVEEKATYEPGWVSYVAAITGVLKSLGVNCDSVDVAGHSGYAFVVNVSKGTTCPSGPTAHCAWEDIHEGSQVFGWNIESVSEDVSYPEGEEPTSKDLARALGLFELVKKRLADLGRPVVVWGIPVPEYGIVNGYEGDSYKVNTFRCLIDQPDEPVRFDKLQAPGCLEAIFFEEEIPLPDGDQRDLEAVGRAANMAEGAYAPKGYVAGPDAFDEWARVLEESPDEVIYHGNSYVAACTREMKAYAGRFLDRLASRHAGAPQAEPLARASEEYGESERLMEEFVEIFSLRNRG